MSISKYNIIKEDFDLDVLKKYIIDIKEVAEIYYLYYMHKNFIEKFSIMIAKEFCLNYNEEQGTNNEIVKFTNKKRRF